ncbi:HAD-IA family hydrolase [Quadrisphaera sp. DSM 44207]|uniref:HAD-IA family hydrolase n=1 Tax=Quadrisphaera sp. DSM 44207 TaxID=1881057 RepID=UPI00088C138E|nr:HAD-IA family hydrolase [Quadrisphaera sp. DSM 44207]SDQ37362.1 haloacid dehalogenase superfamily, subfamily IA, variant 3 with third motif having DD or ED [Quadrisphaera sp. DSM 44207]
MPALVFDCDGVLADTERDGHLPAFNATFAEFGLPVRWSEEEYAEKLRVGGGKERMATLFTPELVASAGLPADAAGQKEALAAWHRRKTAVYTDSIERGIVPPRSGVARVVEEAAAAGWQLAVASTSAEPSVRAVLEHVVGPQRAASFEVLAGDVVPAKKPDPAIYLLALERLGVDPDDVVVVEDSRNGLLAARGAGLRCVVTVSSYTTEEDFTGASLVVTELGDPGGPAARVLADPAGVEPGPVVGLAELQRVLQRPAPPAPGAAVPRDAGPATTTKEER